VELTSGLFGWLVALATLAAFTGVVVLWPTVAAARPRQVAARAGMLLGVNLLVVLTAAVQLNDQFLFFAGWADLGGALGGGTTTSTLHGGGTAPRAAAAHVAGPAASTWGAVPEPLPAGSRIQDGVTSYQVAGKLSGVTAAVLVTVPPGYDPADQSTRYPVLETFAGYPGSVSQWVKTMRLQSRIAEQVAAHRLRRMIVVSPQLEVPPGTDTECVDGGPAGAQVETFVARDVPDWLADHFRVRTDRSSWATIGLSAGGWCAATTAMLHPAQFGGAIVMGGYFRPEFGAAYDPFPPHSPAAARYDLVALARRSPPPLALWIETSHVDPVSYSSSAALLKAARPPLSVTAKVLQNSGHRIGVWQGLLPEALSWLGADVPGFGPVS
jgi:enterochelin esterase-like enzyme